MNNSKDNSNFLRLTNILRTYQEGGQNRVVLMNACAEFVRGEFVAIIGKSGSGKSTLLNLISGIDRPDDGSVYFNGQDLNLLSDHQRTIFRRENIGFVFQFFNLVPTLRVIENVSLPLELNSVSRQQSRLRAEQMLAAVGLEDRSQTFPDRLSGGEQQRVAIARALVHDPVLVLADEPTGNLDEETGTQVLQLLDQLTRMTGRNLIMVTHSQEAARIADRVLCLRDGILIDHCIEPSGNRRRESKSTFLAGARGV